MNHDSKIIDLHVDPAGLAALGEGEVAYVKPLLSDDVAMTLIKDGDHRLSRPEDIERLIRAVEGIG